MTSDKTAPAAREGSGESEAGTWGELLRPRYLAATVTLCLGVALFAFNEFFISTALPSAVRELGGAALLSWAFTFYLVFAIVGGMVAANLKQRFGARNTLLAAATVFIAGTLLASFAASMPQVLAGRLLQGAGEGVVAALCYALIPELFPSRLVPKIFGAEAIVWATAAFLGPLISGALTEHWSWRAAFFVNVPVAAIFIALVLFIVPRAGTVRQSGPTIPYLRLVAAGFGILLISLSGTVASTGLMATLLVLAAMILLGVVHLDRRSGNPVLPRRAFSTGTPLGSGFWIILLMPLAQAAAAVFLVYGLQHLWQLGPTAAGFLSAVMAMSWSSTAIVVASLRSQALRNRIIQLGPVLLLAGLTSLLVAMATGTLWLVALGQLAIGAGFGISWGTLSQLMMDVSTNEERDRTSAMLPTLQSAGYAIGAAVFGLVANLRGFDEAASDAVLRSALLTVFTAACAVAAVAEVFGIRAVRLSMPKGTL
ncbi:MFS transporter [Pararhizobium sp.]|uniref:MFS transporter n=1 Tax=Pararhizobium sp. TaxID=1977563 RepID=UPI0027240A16|nr:MFS transporter [Pararhizobium sp.]MDO9414748.1 MFS transporter [Pararhizobium sp.]